MLKGGIEPPIQSYQDCVIPFNYKSMGYPMGFEPMLLEPQPKVLTADTTDTIDWQGVQGSNLWHAESKSAALPTELTPNKNHIEIY